MFNLIKMDLYRMVNAKSFKVMICIVAFFAIAASYSTYSDIDSYENELKDIPGIETILDEYNQSFNAGEIGNEEGDADDFFKGFQEGWEETDEDNDAIINISFGESNVEENEESTLGIFSNFLVSWLFKDINILSLLYADLKTEILFLFLAIFIPLYINAEHKNGYEKNIISHHPERIKPVCSKLIASSIYTLAMIALYALTCLCTYVVLLGDRIYIGELGKYLPFLATAILMHIAFSWFICFLCILSRSNSLAMTTGILISTQFTAILYMGIDKLIDKFFSNNDFTLTDKMLEIALLNLGNVGEKLSEAIPPKMIIIPLVYMVFSTVVSIIIMRKRDVR